MVMEALQEDMGEGNMQCINHPFKNNSTPGGICAFCLQEKLGKLVSSSFPIAVFPSSSSSPSPSFRSDFLSGGSKSAVPVRNNTNPSIQSRHFNSQNNRNNNNSCHHHQYYSRRSRIPFLLTQKKKKKGDLNLPMAAVSDPTDIVFNRSKSTTTPRRGVHFLDVGEDNYSYQKRHFWSFLYLSKNSTNKKGGDTPYSSSSTASTMGSGSYSHQRTREKKVEEFVSVDENESPNQASFDRKVSRSRSVGCGSRSFSGDFFERISTGFGDCTLRRVESQREGKPKGGGTVHGGGGGGQDCIKERVKCGGIFSGFTITSTSSSSSTSSYWVSSENMNGKGGPPSAVAGHLAHGRSKSWGWAFASPIRAFSKPSGKREATSNKNNTPNLAAIPSLLAVRS